MVDVWKEESPIEQKVMLVEDCMDKLGISIDYTYGGIVITVDEKEYPIIDIESGHGVTRFPRTLDGERIGVKK